MRRRVGRLLGAAALAAVLVVAASGCGGGGGGSPTDAVTGAPDRLVEQETARLHQTVTVAGLPSLPSGTADTTFSGAFELETGNGTEVLDLSSLVPSGTSATLSELSVRVVDGVLYMDLASGGGEPVGGVRWLKLDPKSFADPDAVPVGLKGGAVDLPGAFGMLEKAMDDVEAAGSDDVRGDATTRYRGHLPYDVALAKVPVEVRREVGALDTKSQAPVPFEAWLDGDGVPRRLELTLDLGRLGLPDVPAGAVLKLETEAYDFGLDVESSAPPASQVLDFVDYARSLGLAGRAGNGSPATGTSDSTAPVSPAP